MLLPGCPSNVAVRLVGSESIQEGLKIAVVVATTEIFSPIYMVQAPGLTGGEPELVG